MYNSMFLRCILNEHLNVVRKPFLKKIQRLKLPKRVTQKIYNGRRKRLLGFDLSANTSCFVKNYF